MKIAIVDTYYGVFLGSLYSSTPNLQRQSFQHQLDTLLRTSFGTSDFYSRHLQRLGWDAQELIVNCVPLQVAWAEENGAFYSKIAMQVPHRLFRVPVVGPWLAGLPGLMEIAVAQLKALKPDVLYCQDLSFFPPQVLRQLREHVRLIVGQIACPPPANDFLRGYDLILTSFPHFVPRLRALGVASEYFRIGFDTRVLDELGSVEKTVPVSFVGGISRHHSNAVPTFEHLARETPIEFFGYGAGTLDRGSPIVARHHGEVWGLDMYRALASSRMTLNRHISVAENNANNMRLYEATGVGTLLITDQKDNLGELFEPGKEVVTYTSKEEAAEVILHLLEHPREAEEIARAGQKRTLLEHTYEQRMIELNDILKRHME